MIHDHAEIVRRAADVVAASLGGYVTDPPVDPGPCTIMGMPVHIDVDPDGHTATVRFMPLQYEIDTQIGFEPCPT